MINSTTASPAVGVDLRNLEPLARAELDPGVYHYIAAGAGTGSAALSNVSAFGMWSLIPRVLANCGSACLETSVLGEVLPAPLLLAPAGALSYLNPAGERAVAIAAAECGIPFVLSSASSSTIEQVAEAGQAAPRWFQLYWPNDTELCLSILLRARLSGYRVLVYTVDFPRVGWRPGPPRGTESDNPRLHSVAIPFSDPVFRDRLGRAADTGDPAAWALWEEFYGAMDRTWDDLSFLRDAWDGPIVLKGILHPADARRAADLGMDGVIVSNHGGRQVDGAITALDALPGVADAVGDRMDVLFDSGIRGAADVLKALALGAKAVMLGRPYLYAFALAGQEGVRQVLGDILADLESTLTLVGCSSPAAVSGDFLRRSSAWER
jgi:lactate 2-monooxygenase